MTRKEDKLIYEIDFEYKNLFRKIIVKILHNNSYIPITWEDIYFEFLIRIPEIFNAYDKSRKVPFKTYLGLQCRYFALNHCKKYRANKFKILNSAGEYNDEVLHLSDSYVSNKTNIDIGVLNQNELKIYESYFILDQSMVKVADNLKTTIHYVRKHIKSIRLKIYRQLRN